MARVNGEEGFSQLTKLNVTDKLLINGMPVTSGVSPIVQVVSVLDGEVNTKSVQLPVDDSIPQNTQGSEFMSLAITPTSATNLIVVQVTAMFGASISLITTMALFKDAISDAVAAQAVTINGSTEQGFLTLNYSELAGTTSPVTWKVRAGPSVLGTITFNGMSGSRLFGGVANSGIHIYEIQQ